jgi:hypothetical protein
MASYTAQCHREGKFWVIEVPELDPPRVTQTPRRSRIEFYARDLVRIFTGTEAESVTIRFDPESR